MDANSIIAIVGATLGLLAVLAKVTPNPKDDGWAAKALEFFNLTISKTGGWTK